MLKKNLANMISGLRILGSLILIIFFNEFSTAYLIIYCLSAVTDMFDGYVARKTNTCSVTGVIIDSIADVMISVAMVKVLIVQKMVPGWMLVWLGIIIVIFLGICTLSQIKFKRFYFPHTLFDKLIGVAVGIMPVMIQFVDHYIYMFIVGMMLTCAAIETSTIQIKSKEAKDFVRSIFHINK